MKKTVLTLTILMLATVALVWAGNRVWQEIQGTVSVSSLAVAATTGENSASNNSGSGIVVTGDTSLTTDLNNTINQNQINLNTGASSNTDNITATDPVTDNADSVSAENSLPEAGEWHWLYSLAGATVITLVAIGAQKRRKLGKIN